MARVTCVVGLATGREVFMAADSVNNVYGRPIRRGAVKIRRFTRPDGGQALIGVCGEGAMAQLLTLNLKPWESISPETDEMPLLQAWADDVAMKVTAIAREYDCFENGRIAGSYLLGWRGQLWTLTHNQAMPHVDGLAAIGSGEELAMGAACAYLNPFDPAHIIDPRLIVERAVEIACRYDRYCEGPVQVEHLVAS